MGLLKLVTFQVAQVIQSSDDIGTPAAWKEEGKMGGEGEVEGEGEETGLA